MSDSNTLSACAVCGGSAYQHRQVLWEGLVSDWQLSEHEAAYIDRQQGTQCLGCGSNLRSIALAKALCEGFGRPDLLLDQCIMQKPSQRLLEVNQAGTLHSRLCLLPGHFFISYPKYDLMNLALTDASFDLVVHSDTLEHVPDPVRALTEIRRVLRPGGRTIFTTPILVGKMTRSREGLLPSYHGDSTVAAEDLLVHTEFGADAWAMVLKAGFSHCEFVSFDYPSAIAISALR